MALIHLFGDAHAPPLYFSLPLCGLGFLCLYLVYYAIYQLLLNPLRQFPGPKLWALSGIPYVHMFLSGNSHRETLQLHETYGPIVRIGPRHLSINHPDGMKEVRGHRKTGENGKDHNTMAFNGDNIIGANRADHQRFRRALSHAFSAQAMQEQQPLITRYVDTLLKKLHEGAAGGSRPVNIEKWFNYTTFDIIGDLTFGEPFGCLEDEAYHPWVALIFTSIKNLAFLAQIKRLPWLGPILKFLIPANLKQKFGQHKQLSREKIKKRLSLDHSRPDFVDSMVRKTESTGGGITVEELSSNASVLIIAGSETTATLLSAATYFLGTHPHVLKKLNDELSTHFKSEAEIDLLSVQGLTYMLAVLDESARLYPPVPSASPRMIGPGGDTILGRHIPEGTSIDIWQWALYHNPAHFSQAEDFIPERWMGDPRFANDAKQSFQPFSVGPRNCIGKNLAYAEMRLILARLVWNFDIRVAEDTLGWHEKSESYVLWQKGPLNVYLSPKATLAA